jgi:hypothetical protein
MNKINKKNRKIFFSKKIKNIIYASGTKVVHLYTNIFVASYLFGVAIVYKFVTNKI